MPALNATGTVTGASGPASAAPVPAVTAAGMPYLRPARPAPNRMGSCPAAPVTALRNQDSPAPRAPPAVMSCLRIEARSRSAWVNGRNRLAYATCAYWTCAPARERPLRGREQPLQRPKRFEVVFGDRRVAGVLQPRGGLRRLRLHRPVGLALHRLPLCVEVPVAQQHGGGDADLQRQAPRLGRALGRHVGTLQE